MTSVKPAGGHPRDSMRVLVVEDHAELAESVARVLRRNGIAADVASDGSEAISQAGLVDYDVVVLDRDLPRLHGDEVCRKLAAERSGSRVLMLTAASTVRDRVEGLGLGADDYLPKPYSFSELLARVEALARRQAGRGEDTQYRVGDLELDRLSHRVVRGKEEILLQPREFRLLEYLMKHAGQVVTRTMLLENVWDYHFDPQTNVIDVHISRLRSKIDKGFAQPLLHTVRGAGYMIRDGAR